jgi:hypothetical protein
MVVLVEGGLNSNQQTRGAVMMAEGKYPLKLLLSFGRNSSSDGENRKNIEHISKNCGGTHVHTKLQQQQKYQKNNNIK